MNFRDMVVQIPSLRKSKDYDKVFLIRTTMKISKTPSFFIIGYSGVGKTTLSKLLNNYLQNEGYSTFLLDGNDMNESGVLFHYDGTDINSRFKRAKQLTKLTNWINKQGLIPIAAVIGQPEKARKHWRQHIENYFRLLYLKNL